MCKSVPLIVSAAYYLIYIYKDTRLEPGGNTALSETSTRHCAITPHQGTQVSGLLNILAWLNKY